MQCIKLLLLSFILALPYCASAIIYRFDTPLAQFQNLARQPLFDGVGMICDTAAGISRPIGSCVLIAPNYVLTAQHILNRNTFHPGAYRVILKDTPYRIASIPMQKKATT